MDFGRVVKLSGSLFRVADNVQGLAFVGELAFRQHTTKAQYLFKS
jgi:hypothetical protein